MKKLLTVSVAAYNMQDYINKALNSLVLDSSLLSFLEVFIIDDGGSDETLKIAKEFHKKYPETFFAIHKDNGGYGSTVNWAVDNARGKYFKLLDGDDWVSTLEFADLIRSMRTINTDVIVNNVVQDKEDGKTSILYQKLSKMGTWNIDSLSTDELPLLPMWALSFRTENLRKHFIRLPEHCMYTDQVYVLNGLVNAKNYYIFPKVVYHWRLGREEQSNNVNTISKHTEDIKIVIHQITSMYTRERKFNNNRYLLRRIGGYYAYLMNLLLMVKHTRKNWLYVKQIDQNLKKNEYDVYQASMVGKKLKILRKTQYFFYWVL